MQVGLTGICSIASAGVQGRWPSGLFCGQIISIRPGPVFGVVFFVLHVVFCASALFYGSYLRLACPAFAALAMLSFVCV